METTKTPRPITRAANSALSAARFRDRRLLETSAACVAARDNERLRLAREIHDDLGAELTALRFALARLGVAIERSGQDAQCASALSAADSALNAAFVASRRLIDERGTASSNGDLKTTLMDWIHAFGERIGMTIPFDYKADPRLEPVEEEVARALLRITQEALNNMAKHSHATTAHVRLNVLVSGIVLVIRDDGRGLPSGRARPVPGMPAPLRAQNGASGGVGMQSMRDRCGALGGRLDVISRPGQGLEVRVTLPWRGRVPPERRGGPPGD